MFECLFCTNRIKQKTERSGYYSKISQILFQTYLFWRVIGIYPDYASMEMSVVIYIYIYIYREREREREREN